VIADLARAWRIARATIGLELRLLLRDPLVILFATLWPLVLLLALGLAAPERRAQAPIPVYVTPQAAEHAPWLADALRARGRITVIDAASPDAEVWTVALASRDREADEAGEAIEANASPAGIALVVQGAVGPPGTRTWLEDRVELALVADAPRPTEAAVRPSIVLRREGNAAASDAALAALAWRHALASAVIWSVLVIAVNVAAGFGVERRNGTWTRLRVAPAPVGALVAARLACVVLLAIPLALPLLVVGVVVGAPLSTIGAIVAALPMASLGLGALVVCVVGWAPRSRAGQGLAWAVVLALALLGGAMIPRPLMPPSLAAWSDVSPVAWIAVAFGDTSPARSALTLGAAWGGLLAFAVVAAALAILTVGRDDA
jgi:hypothetical protein